MKYGITLNTKLCFINKVREEHVQIINLINTRGEQSVINPVNKIRGVYIYTADLPLFIGSFPASLRHPFSALTTIPVLICRGVLWVRAKIPSSEPSPRTARQIRINFILFIICKCELVKQMTKVNELILMHLYASVAINHVATGGNTSNLFNDKHLSLAHHDLFRELRDRQVSASFINSDLILTFIYN